MSAHGRAPSDGPRIGAPNQRVTVPARRGSEEYDAVLWRIKPALEEFAGGAFRLGIVSSRRLSGSSTFAAKLAVRAADLGFGPVLLVDANFARPSVRRLFRIREAEGLADCFIDSRVAASATFASHVVGLDLLPAGNTTALRGKGMSIPRLQAVWSELQEAYEFIVVDLPTAAELGPALPLAQKLDAALLVLRSEAVSGAEARRAAHRLAAEGVPLAGAVLTQHRQYLPRWLRRWL